MPLKIDQSSSTGVLLFMIFLAYLFFYSSFESFENITQNKMIDASVSGQIYAQPFVDTSNKDINKIDTKRCSINCCKYTQWPVPFNITGIDADNANIDYSNIVSSNFSCTGSGTGSGCLCVNKDDINYLSNHFTPPQV